MVVINKILKPENVTAIYDSREKIFTNLSPLKMEPGTLATGDFSVKGLEHLIAIERKSLPDLVMCVGRERERFEKEIQRLLAYQVRAIVVEASWDEIEMKTYRGEVHPNAVIGSCLAWITRGVNIVMAGDAKRAGLFIGRLLFTAARKRWEENYRFLDIT